jgi:hypothetical protein
MMRAATRLVRLDCLVLGIVLAVGSIATAEAIRVPNAVRQLLEIGWQPSFRSRALVDEQYGQLPPAIQADATLKHAYALIMIKQRRYTEAVETVDELVARDDKNTSTLKAKIWLDVLTKKYSLALVGMEKLAGLLKSQANQAAGADASRETAGMLGIMFGYLEGPAGAAVNPAQRVAYHQKILGLLDDPQKAVFEAGRRQVKEQFAALVIEKEDALGKAEKEADQLREQLLKDADSQREQISRQREQAAQKEEKSRDELRLEVERLNAAERPLVEAMTRIERNASFVDAELDRIVAEIERVEIQLRDEEDPDMRERLIRSIHRLEIRADRCRADLLQIERQAAVAEAQLIDLRRQRLAAQSRYQQDRRRSEREQANLDRRDRQVGVVERKARRTTGDKRRSRTLSTRAGAFTTYAAFPVEEEKKRLLDSL